MRMHRVKKSKSNRSSARLGWGIFLFAWVLFIWGHSLVAGTFSSTESGRFVVLFTPLFHAAGIFDTEVMTFVVRKCAHFSEYAVLSVVIANNCRVHGWKAEHIAAAHLASFVIACIDESIQVFVPGRTSSARDIAIDTAGLVVGAAISWILFYAKRRKSRQGPKCEI